MKVMLVAPLFMPEPGGAAVYFDLLSKSLAQKQDVTKILDDNQKINFLYEYHLKKLINIKNQSGGLSKFLAKNRIFRSPDHILCPIWIGCFIPCALAPSALACKV